MTPVICIKLPDAPGELLRVMSILAACSINVVYSYSMISTYIVLSTPDIDEAVRRLADEPVEMIDQDDIARLTAQHEGAKH